MTREEIIRKIANEYSVNEIKAADFYDNIFSTLSKSLAKGKNVNIAEFGKFSVYEKVNESKKKRKLVRFSSVKKFAGEVNRDYSELKAVKVRLIDVKQADSQKSFENDLDLIDYVEDGDYILSGHSEDKDTEISEIKQVEADEKPERKEESAEVKEPDISEKPERIEELAVTKSSEVFDLDLIQENKTDEEDVIFPISKRQPDKIEKQGDIDDVIGITGEIKTSSFESKLPEQDPGARTEQEEIDLIKDGILDSKDIEDDLKNIIAEREKILKEIEAIRGSGFGIKSRDIEPVIPDTETQEAVPGTEEEIIPIQPIHHTPFTSDTEEKDYLNKLLEEREKILKQISNPEPGVFDKLIAEDRNFKEKTIDDDIQNLDKIKFNLKSGSEGTIDDIMTFDDITDFDINGNKDTIVFPEELKGLHDDILTPGKDIIKPDTKYPKKFDDIFIEDSNMLNFPSSQKDNEPHPKHTSDLDDKIKNYDDIFRLSKRPKKR